MKSRNRYFWIFMFFMCGVNLVCSSVVLGHLTEWTVRIRNGYPTPPASITNGDITTTFVAGSFTHPSGNGNNQYHDPVTRLEDCDTTGSNFYHEHQFKIMWDNTADSNSAIESTVRGEWYCSPTRRKIKGPANRYLPPVSRIRRNLHSNLHSKHRDPIKILHHRLRHSPLHPSRNSCLRMSIKIALLITRIWLILPCILGKLLQAIWCGMTLMEMVILIPMTSN